MPRKRKEKNLHPEGYEILIGYIKKFKYHDPSSIEEMCGHPIEGRCYRIIRDKTGHRIHIGRENTKEGLDGLYLGNTLKAKSSSFTFDIELVTPQNFLTMNISEEDTMNVMKWIETDNKDLWDQLKLETSTPDEVMKHIAEKIQERIQRESVPNATVNFKSATDSEGDIRAAQVLSQALTTISSQEPEAMAVIVDIIEYVASTYEDKYASKSLGNITKKIHTESAIGAPANIAAVMKYGQRYLTEGYEKSYNTKDLHKMIHYTLFELQRRKHQDRQ